MLAPLPPALVPPAPFPLVVAQAQSTEFVAPGVRRGTYLLTTAEGPLVVHVVAIDPSEPTIRLGAVVASDRMISRGETVSSMARRTGAIAGVNADYFDIGNTYQPLGVVVRDGALVRTPSKRIALDVGIDRSVRFENFSFSGSVAIGNVKIPLTGVNEWPPQGGATLLTPAYGIVKAATGVRLAEIVPIDVAHDASHVAGDYRIASIGSSQTHAVLGTELGLGPAALASGAVPAVGDAIVIDAALQPPIDALVCAVGGGPLLVANGAIADDPNAPAPEERDRRFPVSGALKTANGTLVLVEVDGRAPALSVGVTRPQFAALAIALGAVDAMAFDSGGSAELVARTLGERDASVFGSPSDGEERHVADGLFVYSDAPIGPPAQLVVRPSAIVAVPHAKVAVRAAFVDAAGHALGDAHLDGGDTIVAGAVSGTVIVRAGALRATVPVDVVTSLARLDLASDVRVPESGTLLHVIATGYDARGRVVALGDSVAFDVTGGHVAANGTYRVGTRDATVVARSGTTRASLVVRVGRRMVALPFFDPANRGAWHYATAPAGLPGALAFTTANELVLPFDFTGNERAAYANVDGLTLPGEPLAFSVEIASSVRGIGVRASFVNRLGETRAITLTKGVDWDGFRTRTVEIPNDLNPPVRMLSLYAVDTLGTMPARVAGEMRFRNATAVVAGNP